MQTELIKQLLEAGVHFGHQTKRWNPKMKKFIFGEKSGIYIIDLEKTAECLDKARIALSEVIGQGKAVLFVGTKKQAQEIIQEQAIRCESPFANYRWIGGLLTNFQTVRKNVQRLKDIEEMEQDGRINKLTKKEIGRFMKEKEKLKRNLSGIIEMERLPGALFVVDPKKEETAVLEANRLNIPVVALIDTNCDPDKVDYPIPGNDDALKSIRMITTFVADSIIEARKSYKEVIKVLEEQKKVETAIPEEAAEAVVPEIDEEIVETIVEKIVDDKDTKLKKPIKAKPIGRPKGKKEDSF
ncbi:MAG: 30S ribosomal protein S2 [Candidatus Omnitrophica bacterium]|nr:30S ribosomal protein S2 [Candidatus Omnitrophota bacterium]MDD5351799.1 30S ribosomal protein S2 [Candidatus Omnitrophota bacterium]MDD5550625.1 30S ribosomal protein S2 [Candidatus Omnitrophota bacterium]